MQISIHAPHTGRDSKPALRLSSRRSFQSTRPIRGATHRFKRPQAGRSRFQSTRPIRGATRRARSAYTSPCISIHAPHTGRDANIRSTTRRRKSHFNPRAPYGARHARHTLKSRIKRFQSTRPIRGATPVPLIQQIGLVISIHAPHTGRDTAIPRNI